MKTMPEKSCQEFTLEKICTTNSLGKFELLETWFYFFHKNLDYVQNYKKHQNKFSGGPFGVFIATSQCIEPES